jgi:hypothetical protein
MRSIILAVIPAFIVACSSYKSEPQASYDSISVDTTSVASFAFSEDTLQYLLDHKLESYQDDFNDKINQYLTLNVSLSGYEYQSDITWYFDSGMNIIAYYEEWSMEGNSGTRHAYFDKGKLVAVKDEDYEGDTHLVTLACESLAGRIYTELEPDSQMLSADYLPKRNTELMKQLSQMITQIDAEGLTPEDETIDIHLETIVDVGGNNVTETTDFTLDKTLFDKLDQIAALTNT